MPDPISMFTALMALNKVRDKAYNFLDKTFLKDIKDKVKAAGAKASFNTYMDLLSKENLSDKENKKILKLEKKYPVFKKVTQDELNNLAKSDPEFFNKLAKSKVNSNLENFINGAAKLIVSPGLSDDSTTSGTTGTSGTETTGINSLQNLTNNPRLTPQQIETQKNILNLGYEGLKNTDLDFNKFAQNARTKFAQSAPSIANRFGIGGVRGSDYLHALQGAQSDLESNLAGLESQYNLKKHGAFQNLAEIGLKPVYGTPLIQQQQASPGQQFGESIVDLFRDPGFQNLVTEWRATKKPQQKNPVL